MCLTSVDALVTTAGPSVEISAVLSVSGQISRWCVPNVPHDQRIGRAHLHHGSVSSTPLWVPLVVAGIGVLGTLIAGVVGALTVQRWASQREDKAWAREREREQQRWAREDEARTFEHRREVFEDFYQAVKALAQRAYAHGYGFDRTPELPFDWNADAFAKLTRLGLYADRRVAAAASAAYSAAWAWGQHTRYDDPDDPEFYERQETFDQAEYELLALVRQALSIPEGDLSLPLPGKTANEATTNDGGKS